MGEIRLEHFTTAELEEYVFPGTDAAVVFIPDGQSPPPEVADALGRAGQQRWYPVPGGHRAKIPFHHAHGCEHCFELEPKGWDHEHCDFCDRSVAIGELCWTSPSERGVYVFCASCHAKVPRTKRWWKVWR